MRQPWLEFIESIKNPELYKNKKALPLLRCAYFGDMPNEKKCLRHEEKIRDISGIEIDYDGEVVSIDEGAELLRAACIEAVLYSTPRSSHAQPHWRAICPLLKPRKPSERGEFVALINSALGGIAAPESFTTSQAFYFGAVEGTAYEWRHVEGCPVDDGPDLVLLPTYKAGPPRVYELSSLDDIPDTVTDGNLRDIGEAVQALKPERADSYATWIGTLQHLKHLAWCGRAVEAEDLAREFSMRSSKFNENAFFKKWQQLSVWKGHFKTLFVLAEQDGWSNPIKDTETGLKDMTDAGNVNTLAAITMGNLRYVHERAMWIFWTGERWQEDSPATHATRSALAVAATYKDKATKQEAEAAQATTSAEKKQYQKLADSFRTFSNYCRNKRGIDAILALAARDDRFVIRQGALDQDIYLMGVQNGVVDLRTGQLREVARDDFITKQSPYAYRQDASAPRFLQFVSEITSHPIDDGDTLGPMRYKPRPELAQYEQKALG